METEMEWVINSQVDRSFDQVEHLITRCIQQVPSRGATDPTRHQLTPKNGGDTTQCAITTLGDNIVRAEVAIRYTKVQGQLFKSVAQPDIQWKLQQIQDATNYLSRIKFSLENRKSFHGSDMSHSSHIQFVNQLLEYARSARNTLALPKKRSLVELQDMKSVQCFDPSLPNDLLLSVYIASDKLIASAYHLQNAAGGSHLGEGKHTFHVLQSECLLPWLTTVLELLANALTLLQQLQHKLIHSSPHY